MQQKLENTRLHQQLLQTMGTEEAARQMQQLEMEQQLRDTAAERIAKIQESGAPIEEIRVAEEAVKTELEKQLELVSQLVAEQGKLKSVTDAKYQSEKGATGRAGKAGGGKNSMGSEILGTLKSGLGNVITTALKGGDVKAAMEQLMSQMLDKVVNMLLDKLFENLVNAIQAPAKQSQQLHQRWPRLVLM